MQFILSIGGGTGNPLQYSCLENPMDGGTWQAAVHGVVKSPTRLKDFTFTFHFHALEKEMATHSSVLAWRIPGTGSLVGCRLWGHTESDTTEATQQQQQQYINNSYLIFKVNNLHIVSILKQFLENTCIFSKTHKHRAKEFPKYLIQDLLKLVG